MPASNLAFALLENSRLRDGTNYGAWDPPTEVHQPGSRPQMRSEELSEFGALSLVNVEARSLESVGNLTIERLRDSQRGRPYILDPIALKVPSFGTRPKMSHVIDHRWTGLEPFVAFNVKMKELPADQLSGPGWLESTRSAQNILPLLDADHDEFDTGRAGMQATSDAAVAYVLATEEALAAALAPQRDEQGEWQPNLDPWELHPGEIVQRASVVPPVSYQVKGVGEKKEVATYAYDWWQYPRREDEFTERAGYFFPGEGLQVLQVGPADSWADSVPIKFSDRPLPSIQSAITPVRAVSRFDWQRTMRMAQGDPLSFSREGRSTWTILDYWMNLLCVRDWASCSAMLKRRPNEGLPAWSQDETGMRLRCIRSKGAKSSGQRIFPRLRPPSNAEPQTTRAKKRGHDDFGDDAAPGPSQGPSPRTAGSTSGATANCPSTKSAKTSSSSSASGPSSSQRSSRSGWQHGAFSPSQTIAAKWDAFWEVHAQILVFLEECLDEGSLDLRDLTGGWPSVAERLPAARAAQAEAMLRSKVQLTDDIVDLEEEQRQQMDEERLRSAYRSVSPVEMRRRHMAGSARCSPSPGLSAADSGSETTTPQSPTESF